MNATKKGSVNRLRFMAHRFYANAIDDVCILFDKEITCAT